MRRLFGLVSRDAAKSDRSTFHRIPWTRIRNNAAASSPSTLSSSTGTAISLLVEKRQFGCQGRGLKTRFFGRRLKE
ncbi:hypothetical protein NPIL_388271 [Nephila pilipes]|uniref:Uncharacterized protein n=1 Tax=Nephila pilipes TaxID=299642 RepID=A0A8X6Q2T7_NEPPI|nr:hypothetical protein NPIL_388271 [Nephila pilipes]